MGAEVWGFDFSTLADEDLNTSSYLLKTIESLRHYVGDSTQFVLIVPQSFAPVFSKLQGSGVIQKFYSLPLPNVQALRLYAQQSIVPLILARHRVQLLQSVGWTLPAAFTGKKVLSLTRKALRMPCLSLLPAIAWSQSVIVETEALQNEVKKRFPLFAHKLRVVQAGFDLTQNESPEALASLSQLLSFKGPYFVQIGTISAARSSEALEAFAKIAHRPRFRRDRFIFCGKKDSSFPTVERRAKELNLSDRILFLDPLSSDRVEALLRGARFMLYMGSGLEVPPIVLQALAWTCPVIMSTQDGNTLPFSPALMAFKGSDPKLLAELMTKAASDESIKQWLRGEGFKALEKRAWPAVGAAVSKIYRESFQATSPRDSSLTVSS